MSDEYAGTPTYHATVTVADDGDPPTAASIAAGIEDCADRETYLKGKADAFEITKTRVTDLLPGYSPSVVRTLIYGREALVSYSDTPHVVSSDLRGGGHNTIAQVNAPNGEEIWVALTPSLPHGAVIHSIAANVSAGNWDTMPSTAAQIALVERDEATETEATLVTMSDTSVDTTHLNTWHRIYWDASGVGLNVNVEPRRRYWLKLIAPFGGTGTSRAYYLLSVEIGVKGQAL